MIFKKKAPFTSGYTPPSHNERKVFCNETGLVYESCSEAERALNIPAGMVSKQIKERIKTARGYTFKEVSNVGKGK